VNEPATAPDPVRLRRARIDRWNRLATRVGYTCFGVAIVVFVVGFVVGFSSAVATVVIAAMVVGSVLLAPAIVIGYAVKAAEREDRERGI
jgi:ABC-type transport system involved in cytochrome bd biosynthesis fused ATPase/permease subunit